MDCIVIRSLSRTCSDYVKQLALLKLLRHLNIRLISVDEKYDSTLIEGVLNKIKKLNEDANINGWGQVSTSKPTLPKP